jgi:hypothetical protein
MPSLINWGLLKNPLNWLIVWLMFAFALVAIGIIKPITLSNPTGTS